MGKGSRSVRRLLTAAIQAGKFPGAVGAWNRIRSESINFEAVGRAHLIGERAGEVVLPSTWFDLASLTKPLVTTTLFLGARSRTGVGLDTRVGEILKDFEISSFPGDRSLGSLLTHTSGMPAWIPLYDCPNGEPDSWKKGGVGRIAPRAAEGRHLEYSCLGFILLGFVLESLLGKTLDAAFRDFVARPLGLEDEIGYHPEPKAVAVAGGSREGVAERELLKDRGLLPDLVPPGALGRPDDGNARFLGGSAGNSGLFGTAGAVHRVAMEYFPGGGDLLSAADVEFATEGRTSGLGQDRALGWQLASTAGSSAGESLSPQSYGHTGFTGTSLWLDPVRRQAMVLLANRHHPEHRLADLHPLRRRFNTLVVSGE